MQSKLKTLFSYQVDYAIKNNNTTIIEKYLKNNLLSILIKYTGNLEDISKKICTIEKISDEHAIVTCHYKNYFKVISKKEVISSELPFETNFFQDISVTSAEYKNFSCLVNTSEDGSNTIIGVIDSGIDYKHPEFLKEDGTTKIKYILDFSLDGNGYKNLSSGRVFTEGEINDSLQNNTQLEHMDFIGHGTSVASICAGKNGVSPKSHLCIVKLSNNNTKSHEILKGIYFLREISKSLNLPLSINLSIGGNNTSHSGKTLYEEYLDKFSKLNKMSICVATGNEGVAGHHFALGTSEEATVISNLKKYNVYIFTPKDSKVRFKLLFDIGVVSKEFTKEDGVKYFKTDNLEYYVSYGSDDNDIYDAFNILVEYPEAKNSLLSIDFEILKTSAPIHMYLPTLEKVGFDTYFAKSTLSNTLTFPATSNNVISVAGVNSQNNTLAPFSGRGYTVLGKIKPNITAPAVDIPCADSVFGYTFKTGTSFATPIVTGICSLIFQNNPNITGELVKILIENNPTRLPSLEYPNEDFGYGFVCYEKIKNSLTEEKLLVDYLVSKQLTEIPPNNITTPYLIKDELFNYYVIKVNYKDIPRFQNEMYKYNIEFEKSKILGATLQSSINSTGIPTIWENQKLFGKNTTVAFIDTGITVKNTIFIKNGETRVNNIYDISQNILYTKEDIQKVINDDLNDFDEIGHGTQVFSVSSANMEENYSGCAPESEMSCSKISDTTKGNKLSSFVSEDLFGVSSIDILKGLEFLLNYKKEYAKPMVIGIPYTTNEGSKLNTGIFEKVLNEYSNKKCLCVVAPTGNDGLSKRHSTIFLKKNVKQYFSFNIEDELTKLSLYTRKDQSFFITLGSANFKEINFTLSQNTTFIKETFDYNVYVNFNNSKDYTELEIGLNGFIRGIWYIEITSIYSDIKCEMNLPIKALSKGNTSFFSSKIIGTIGIPATVPSLIATSGYNHITGEIYDESSSTDTPLYRDIDIASPAENILTYSITGEKVVSGTSMSVAHTVGLISLVFEKHPSYSVNDIREILRKNALKDYAFDTPNDFYGYGKLFLDKVPRK